MIRYFLSFLHLSGIKLLINVEANVLKTFPFLTELLAFIRLCLKKAPHL